MHGEDQNTRRGNPIAEIRLIASQRRQKPGMVRSLMTRSAGSPCTDGRPPRRRLLRPRPSAAAVFCSSSERYPFAYDRVIVDEQDGRALVGWGFGWLSLASRRLPRLARARCGQPGTGIWARNTRPDPREASMLNWPPSATIRSRMPSSPMPVPAARSALALPSSSTAISICAR